MTSSSPPFPRPDRFILASASPRRREFVAALSSTGAIPFTLLVPGSTPGILPVDETPQPNESPPALVRRLSYAKAQAVVEHLLKTETSPTGEVCIIIAADTVVAIKVDQQEQILGKPATPAEAVTMLTQLRDQPHFVYSGLTIARLWPQPDTPASYVTRLHQSQVWMRPYLDAEIEAYVATGSPLDKAGAYGIQDEPFAPVARMAGCFASVMGLPLGELAAALRELNLSLPEIGPLCSRHIGIPCCLESQS